MTLTLTILVAALVGAIVTGGVITTVGIITIKKINKSKQAYKAKEVKLNKTIDYLNLNVKQLNNRLQLEETPIAKKLDSFNIEKEVIDNYVINAKASKKELTEKEIKKVTKAKI